MTNNASLQLIETLSSEQCLCLDNDAHSKRSIFEHTAKIGAQFARDDSIKFQHILRCLQDREKLGCTAIGHGIAIPHARIPALKKPLSVLIKLEKPTAYGESESVDLIFALLVPEDAPNEHLQLLSQIAQLLQQPDLADKLRGSSSPEELFITLSTSIQKHHDHKKSDTH